MEENTGNPDPIVEQPIELKSEWESKAECCPSIGGSKGCQLTGKSCIIATCPFDYWGGY